MANQDPVPSRASLEALLEHAQTVAAETPQLTVRRGGILRPTNATRLRALVGELADALAALLSTPAPAQGEGWQPIETAPTDGPVIVLVEERIYPRGRVTVAMWSEAETWRECGGVYVIPTHWMPLPIPPEGGE